MFDIEQTVINPLGKIPVRVLLDQSLGEVRRTVEVNS
jgi:hypothetical protein